MIINLGRLGSLSVGFKRANLSMGSYLGGNRYAGGSPFWYGLLPGAKVDYQRLAGDKWKNAVIAASLAWIDRNLPQAPPCIYREDKNGEESIVPGHPLTALLKRPNPYYDGRTLRQATFLSLIAGGSNAYWWVKRGSSGLALELWYLPHFDVWPLWSKESTTENWIEGYAYRQNGQVMYLSESEVIHFRDGLDPENQRLGLDRLKPASREIVTDNEASGFAAALLKNMGVPGALITPADVTQQFQKPDADTIKAQFEEQTQADNRGRPIVLSGPVKVEKVAFNPQELLLDTAQDRPEARLCAIIGINAVVLGLPVGLAHSTYSNMEEARRAAWEDGIIPRLELINSELDTQLLAFYPDSQSLRVGADYRRVRALQDSLDDTYKRLSLAVGGPFVTPNEARAQLDLPDVENGENLYPPKSGGFGNDSNASDNQQASGGKAKSAFLMRYREKRRAARIESRNGHAVVHN